MSACQQALGRKCWMQLSSFTDKIFSIAAMPRHYLTAHLVLSRQPLLSKSRPDACMHLAQSSKLSSPLSACSALCGCGGRLPGGARGFPHGSPMSSRRAALLSLSTPQGPNHTQPFSADPAPGQSPGAGAARPTVRYRQLLRQLSPAATPHGSPRGDHSPPFRDPGGQEASWASRQPQAGRSDNSGPFRPFRQARTRSTELIGLFRRPGSREQGPSRPASEAESFAQVLQRQRGTDEDENAAAFGSFQHQEP